MPIPHGPALLLAVIVLLAGCAGGEGGGSPTASAVDVTAADCVQAAQEAGDGYAGAYVETRWNITAAGTAAGATDVVLTLSAKPSGNDLVPWHGDAVVSTAAWEAWGQPPGRTAKRMVGDTEQTSWALQGISVSHTDYSDLQDDDVSSFRFVVEAVVGDPGVGELVRDSQTVVCA